MSLPLPLEIQNNRVAIELEVQRFGAELVELSYRKSGGRNVLSVIADKLGGITLDDCVRINHRLGEFLDELAAAAGENAGFTRSPYFLEVNSPGLDRPLRSEADFRRAAGERVRVFLLPEEGKQRSAAGKIVRAENGVLELEGAEGGVTALPIEKITKAVREIQIGR